MIFSLTGDFRSRTTNIHSSVLSSVLSSYKRTAATQLACKRSLIDDYTKNGGPGEV